MLKSAILLQRLASTSLYSTCISRVDNDNYKKIISGDNVLKKKVTKGLSLVLTCIILISSLVSGMSSIVFASSENLLQYGDFEQWEGNKPTGWYGSTSNIDEPNVSKVEGDAQSENTSVRLMNTSSTHRRFSSQPITLEGGVNYTLTYWVKGSGDIRNAYFGSDYSAYSSYTTLNSNIWKKIEYKFTLRDDAKDAEIIFSVRNTVDTHIQIDNVVLVTDKDQPITDEEAVAEAKGDLVIGYAVGDGPSAVTGNVSLPALGLYGTTISWSSDKPDVITSDGTVRRPEYPSGDSMVVLTASVSKNGTMDTRSFVLNVKETYTSQVFSLTVENGTGSGGYRGGELVTIEADAPTTGKGFDRWVGGNGGTFADATSSTTTFTMPAEAATITATYRVPLAHGIGLSETGRFDFDSASAGYADQTPYAVMISNTGSEETGILTVELSGIDASAFTLSKTSIDSIAAGGSDSFTVVPNIGLTAGTYSATVTVSGDSVASRSFIVSFTVMPIPDAPANVTSIAGDRQVTLKWDAVPGADSYTLYKYEGTSSPAVEGDWVLVQANVIAATYTVTGLTNGTSYAFAVKATGAGGTSGFSQATTAIPRASSSGEGSYNIGGNSGHITSASGRIIIPFGSSGEVSLDGSIIIQIPAGAAAQELRITIDKLLEPSGLLSDQEMLVSQAFEVLKNINGNFKKPVKLSIKFDPAKVGHNQKAAIHYYDEEKKTWVEVGGTVDGTWITVEVDHFTKFAVLTIDLEKAEGENTPGQQTPTFSDVLGHWGKRSIILAAEQKLVSGYPDGTFKPDSPVTRAEFTVMLAGALQLDGTEAPLNFKDQDKIGTWAKRAVGLAVQAGNVSGYKDGSFRPNAQITRAEMAAMIARAMKLSLDANASTGFADDADIAEWAKGAVEAIRKRGIVSGRGDNNFVPNGTATRAEAVVTLLRMLEARSTGAD